MSTSTHYKGDTAFQVLREFPVGANQIIETGDFVKFSAGTLMKQSTAPTTPVLLGVAASALTTGGTPTADDTILVDITPHATYTMLYTGATPELGEKYNMIWSSSVYKVNGDNTTDGFLLVLAVDTDNQTCDVRLTQTLLY